MRAHPLPEAQSYAEMMLTELRKVIPSFLQRVDLAERGGEWSAYLATTRDETARVVERLWPERGRTGRGGRRARGPPGRLRPRGRGQGAGRHRASPTSAWARTRSPGAGSGPSAPTTGPPCWPPTSGDRTNRRHRPGRAFERTDYRFELVTDYGAFRDLQRHRLLTIEWQPLGTALGFDIPDVVVEAGEERPSPSPSDARPSSTTGWPSASPTRPPTPCPWPTGSATSCR